MMLCNHHHDLFAEFFHHFRSSVPLSNNFLFPIFFSCDSNLLSVSVHLPVLDVSYERDHILVLLCLYDFTQNDVVEVQV